MIRLPRLESRSAGGVGGKSACGVAGVQRDSPVSGSSPTGGYRLARSHLRRRRRRVRPRGSRFLVTWCESLEFVLNFSLERRGSGGIRPIGIDVRDGGPWPNVAGLPFSRSVHNQTKANSELELGSIGRGLCASRRSLARTWTPLAGARSDQAAALQLLHGVLQPIHASTNGEEREGAVARNVMRVCD